jgi:hypothetical protein
MKLSIFLFLAIAMLSFDSCKDSSTNPTLPVSVLADIHFENQGQPSLAGWQYGYPIYGLRKTSVSFSNDVPANGGQWSLKVFPPDSFYSVMRYVVHPEQPSQSKQFKLTYSYKSSLNLSCDVLLEASSGSTHYVNSPMTNDSITWAQNSTIFHSNNLTIDSLVVFISMFTPLNKADTGKFILFNEFKVEEY